MRFQNQLFRFESLLSFVSAAKGGFFPRTGAVLWHRTRGPWSLEDWCLSPFTCTEESRSA